MLSNRQVWMNRYFNKLGVTSMVEGQRWNRQYFSVDAEDLLLTNPNSIFLICPNDDSECLKRIYTDDRRAPLKAVQSRRIYRIPQTTMTNYTVDEPLMLRWMAELLYPDAMHRDLRAMYRRTYQDIYGYRISDAEIDQAISLKENLQSAGYDRFAESSAGGTQAEAQH